MQKVGGAGEFVFLVVWEGTLGSERAESRQLTSKLATSILYPAFDSDVIT